MIWAVSLATAKRSCTETDARPTSCDTIAWAVAAPTTPENCRSKTCRNSGSGSGKYPFTPCLRASRSNRSCVSRAPRILWAMTIKSSLCATPPDQLGACVEWSNTLTNCAPCSRSIGVGKDPSDTTTKVRVFREIDQSTACSNGSIPLMPNMA